MRSLFNLVSLYSLFLAPIIDSDVSYIKSDNPDKSSTIPIPKDSTKPKLPKNMVEDTEFLVEVQNPSNITTFEKVSRIRKELDLTKAKLAIALDSIEALNFCNETLQYKLKKCKEKK